MQKIAMSIALSTLLLIQPSAAAGASPGAGGDPESPSPTGNPASAYEDIDGVLRAIRADLVEGYVRISTRQVYEAFGDAAVPQTAAHLHDPNDRVRFWAGGILFNAVRSSEDVDVQCRAAREIIGALRDHQTMARWLNTFPAHVFDAESTRLLVEQIRASDNSHFTRPLITAAGIAEARAIEPDLQRWAADRDSSLWWASNLALARMGDREALKRVMARLGPGLPPPDDAWELPRTIQQLCYIKQPDTIGWVIQALESDLVVPREGNMAGFRYSHVAAVHLGEVLKMPHTGKGEFIDDQDVQSAREWVRQHYRRERFSELVGGELQQWFW